MLLDYELRFTFLTVVLLSTPPRLQLHVTVQRWCRNRQFSPPEHPHECDTPFLSLPLRHKGGHTPDLFHFLWGYFPEAGPKFLSCQSMGQFCGEQLKGELQVSHQLVRLQDSMVAARLCKTQKQS